MIFHGLFLIRMVWRNGSRELLSLPSGCCFYAQNGSSGGGAGVYWTSCRQKGCRYVKKVGSFLYNGEETWDFFVSIASFVFFGGHGRLGSVSGWIDLVCFSGPEYHQTIIRIHPQHVFKVYCT